MASGLNSKNFRTIIGFYLLECPVRTFKKETKSQYGATEKQTHPKYNYNFRKVCKKGKSFDERGLDGANLNTLRAAMRRAAPGIIMKAVSSSEEITEAASDEFIIIVRNDDNVSVTEGYFYLIRNSFAHGEYSIADGYYLLENHKNEKLKGVARIKEKTLLKWIDLVDMTPEELKLTNRSR